MRHNYIKHIILYFIIVFPFISLNASSSAVKRLTNIGYFNSEIKMLRKDIRDTIYVVKARRELEKLPKLKFFEYKVKYKENFWTILARTSLDMDTLISVNRLSSPKDIRPGKLLFLPNMRGVVIRGGDGDTIHKLLKKFKVHPRFVYAVNKTKNLRKKYLFIPCGKLSNLQRSLFLGTAFLYPLKYAKKTSGFGSRRNPFNNKRYEFHSGVDLACRIGTKVFAARAGKVVFTGYKGGYGKLVMVKHEYGYYSLYGHLKHWRVKPGQLVRAGQHIAWSGNTGRTTGPHLHFEIRKGNRAINPGLLLRHK